LRVNAVAKEEQGDDKTREPTLRRLQEARKRGEALKSKEFTSAVVLLAWMSLAALLAPFVSGRLVGLLTAALDPANLSSAQLPTGLVALGAGSLVAIVIGLLAPVALVGLLAAFLVTGPVLTLAKLKPSADPLNPVTGLKRMFSLDNWVEVAKSVAKLAILAVLTGLEISGQLRALAALPQGGPVAAMAALGAVLARLVAWGAAVSLAMGVLDLAYQRYAFLKKLRMNARDIQDERREMEGDPHVKSRRRELHREWANRNSVRAARDAAAVVVNPTHIAVALAYDPVTHPAPVVAAKGEGALAALIRAAAEEAGVPVVRNVELARALNSRVEVDEIVPEHLFTAVAEVIVWARKMKDAAGRDAP
jgi:type III secretion protein U